MINSNSALETAYERLSTGKRVNSAADDAAGLAIGKDLESRVSGLNQAVRNVNDGISMVQIAEGALDEVTSILQRMRDLSVQAANGSLSSTERGYLDTEHSKLATTLNSVLDQAKFVSTDLIGSSATSFVIQSGADATDLTTVSIDALTSDGLGVTGGAISLKGLESVKFASVTDTVASNTSAFSVIISGTTADLTGFTSTGATTESLVTFLNDSANATVSQLTWSNDGDTVYGTFDAAGNVTATSHTLSSVTGTIVQEGGAYGLAAIDTALDTIAEDRANLGATQAQLESTVRNLANVAENTAAATGRIMDTDYAAETANLTKAQILQQAATSVLAQANAQPQSVLALLQ